MCSEHVYASPTVGELAWQPSSGAALSLSFPSCKMGAIAAREIVMKLKITSCKVQQLISSIAHPTPTFVFFVLPLMEGRLKVKEVCPATQPGLGTAGQHGSHTQPVCIRGRGKEM